MASRIKYTRFPSGRCLKECRKSVIIILEHLFPLREVPRGVAQERTDNARTNHLHTCRELTASTHHVKNTHTYFWRTDYIALLVEIVCVLVVRGNEARPQ